MKTYLLKNIKSWRGLLSASLAVSIYLQCQSVVLAQFESSTSTNSQPNYLAGKQGAVTAANPNFVPTVAASQAVASSIEVLGENRTKTAGFQFKWPTITTDASYKAFRDGAIGGYSGNEYNVDLSGDADIYDGLMAGLSYGHTGRKGNDGLGTTDTVDDHYGSLYLAKQLFNCWNVGGALAWVWDDNQLTGANSSNLGSFSHGYTVYTGYSYFKKAFTFNTTLANTYNFQDLSVGPTFCTDTFSWSNNMAWQVDKQWKLGFDWSFSTLAKNDGFAGAPLGESDSWSFGPKVDYKVTDQLNLNLRYIYTAGPAQFDAQTVRLGMSYFF